ncbi:receptor-type tyrosine-protein phosphatase eta-like [Mya arenaria]|uniref:receptor-type tyrosine-protein phosphatase eta-like n=1 Tax=Mya arenaria TaxID=6604 RepID=UPI0022E37FEB|nr:receptor-type tyrosine-protein phosphatase eta-like [Mya arenaria]
MGFTSLTVVSLCILALVFGEQASTTTALTGSLTTTAPSTSTTLKQVCSKPTISHGFVSGNANTELNSTETVSCNTGYDLSGDGTITCQANKTWTTPPTCVIKVCSKPTILHGFVSDNANTEFNSIKKVSCHTGYDLSGDGTITCQANTTWTTLPTCVIKDCNSPPTFEHGTFKLDILNNTKFGATAKTTCDLGYDAANGTIYCLEKGQWTNDSCVIKDEILLEYRAKRAQNSTTEPAIVCSKPEISHGSVTGNATTEFNLTEAVSCNTGYNLSGDGTIICQANKNWTTIPTCMIKVCNKPTISHGSVSGNATTEFNLTETVSCNTGYNLSGNRTIICQANKTWTSVPTCVIKVCNKPTISHGSVSGNATTEFNLTETVSCNTGYNLSGDGTITCQANKTWTSVPTCVIKVCNKPTISHGSVSGNATTEFNSTETVSCNTGYNLSGDGTITCQANKTWTSVPTCVIKVCNKPTISHGSVSGNATTEFNSTETVSCNTGYNLSGNGTITCQANKTWTTVPTCVIKEIQFNESCTPIDGDNPCITDHAVCREEADRGNRCLCNKTFPYFYNDACIAGLNISLTDLKCHVSENPEDGPVPDLIQITCSASSIDEDIFDGYKVRIDNSAREWNFTRANNFIYTLDNLKSGEIYQIDIFATKDSIPSINKKTFHGVTRPVMEANWSLCAITISSFSFQNNDTIVDPFKTFSVEINTTDAKFSANCLSKTTDKATCSILRNESHFNILELNSGSSYEIQIFAQIKFNTKDIRSIGFQRFVIYTVPELPADIEIPLGSITHDSFNVSFENNSNKRFSYWSVSVTNFKTGEWEAEDTRHSDVKSMQISTNITSSTFYLVQVQTHVPMQSSDMFNKTFNTRPRQSSSGHLMKANVTESEIMLFILEDEEERFDYYSLIINSSDAARVTLDGPSNVSCEQSGDNCTFQRTLNFSTKITIKNLTSGTFYPLHLYSRFNGLPSLESQDLSSYTAPLMPLLLEFPMGCVTEKSFEVHITVPNKRFFNLIISVCHVSKAATCITKVVNNTYSTANESVIKVVTVENLSSATNYSITAKTGITNDVKSVASLIYYIKTEPIPVNVDEINIGAVTNSTLTVVWNKPLAHTDGYEIEWNCDSPNIGTSINKHQTQNVTKLSATASNLDPGTFCNVTITAYIINYDNATLQAMGVFKVISNSTLEEDPGSVQHLNFQDVTSKSVNVSWTKPCFANGILTGYSVIITKLLSKGQDESLYTKAYTIDVSNMLMSIYDLLPYRRYKIEVYALNSAGDGELSNVSFRTIIDYPDKPINVSTKDKTSSSLLIEWEKGVHFNGPTKYIVHIQDSVNGSIRIQSCTTSVGNWTDKLSTECNVPGLDAYWDYDIVIDAITFEEGIDELIESSEKKTFRTAEAVPGPVAHFDVKPEENVLEERNFRIDWNKPAERDLNGVLTGFVIHYQSEQIEVNVGPNTTSKTVYHNIIGSYNVSIQARTRVGPGAVVHKEITVKPGAPIKVEESKKPLMLKASVSVDNDENQIAVTLPLAQFLCNSSNGPPTMWGIVVAEADEAARDSAFAGSRDDFQKKIDDMYKTWFQVDGLNNIPPYIVTKPNWRPPCTSGNRRKRFATDGSNIFVIGNEECYGSSVSKEYCNGPLPDGRSFKVKSFVCTDYGCSESVYSQPIETVKSLVKVAATNMTGAFVGGAVSAVVVLVLVVLMIFFMRKRQAACFKKDTESITHTSSDRFVEMGTIQTKAQPGAVYLQGPVKLTEFPAFVEKMHKDNDLIFADAYKTIKEPSPKHPCTVAKSQNCRAKNRYTHSFPYDHSRVKLRPSDNVGGSDYINANYIPGYTSPSEYIATQGPIQATFDDFWRMVWEQNVDIIVMLTKLVENGRIKCDKYWPDVNKPKYYGDLLVSVASESNLSDYILRIFEIKLNGERRSVRQFAYLKWPDMGCPEFPEMLLEFLEAVKVHNKRQHHTRDKGPMVVHCSAGVGRTGTFIVVDHLMQHIRHHDDVDVYKLVLDMNNHRCNMVQTEDQFIFIHECLKACISSDRNYEEVEEHMYEQLTNMGRQHLQ